LRFATKSKQQELQKVLREYSKVVNIFIAHFWKNGTVEKRDLLKPIVNIPQNQTWLTYRLCHVAAREAIAMVNSVKALEKFNRQQLTDSIEDVEKVLKKLKPTCKKNRRKLNNLHKALKSKTMRLRSFKPTMPRHNGKSMSVSSTIAELQKADDATDFDAWLHIWCVGNKISLDLPIRFHKHYNELTKKGKRLNSYIISKDTVIFVFEIDVGPKKPVKKLIGIDSGVNVLAVTSNGKFFGTDIKDCIARINRCQHGSEGQKQASRALRQRLDEIAKDVANEADLVVVENIEGIGMNTKLRGRLSRTMRSFIGRWNERYWYGRLQQNCEANRVSFRSVMPYYNSITCPTCGNVDKKNRLSVDVFECSVCCHAENAHIVGAKNSLNRFITGPYGACYKTLVAGQCHICP
jgi:putative transposase